MDPNEVADALGGRDRIVAIFDQRLPVVAEIENMDKPWAATLFGSGLGGVLELPQACR